MATPRVLVIDGDRASIEELRDEIDRAGYDMEIALTAATAISILDQRRMDAVILNLDLADLKSVKTVRDIRRISGSAPLIGIDPVTSAWEEKALVREEMTHCVDRVAGNPLALELERVLPSLSLRK